MPPPGQDEPAPLGPRPPDPADAAAAAQQLDRLRGQVEDPKADRARLRQDLLDLRLRYPGSPQAVQAAALLTRLPSPLDRLDPANIPAADRFEGRPKELVAVLPKQAGEIMSLSFSADGRTLAAATQRAVRLWDLGGPTPRERAVLPDAGWHVRFAPDGRTLVTASQVPRLWDVSGDRPRELARLAGHSHGPLALAFSDDGKLLAAGNYGPVVRLWDLRGDRPRERGGADATKGKGVASLALSPDGSLLAGGSDTGDELLQVWRVTEAGLMPVAVPPVKARHVAFAPDGKTLAYEDGDWDVHLLDLTRPVPADRAVLKGHQLQGWGGIVWDLAYAADGRRLVSGGQDGRVIVWDPADGTKRQERKLPAEVRAVALAPDGRHVAAGCRSGTVYLLRLAAPGR